MDRIPNDHNPPGGISTRVTSRLASPSAVSADPPRVNDYDSFAEAYSAENEASLINAYHERPATLALAGDVTGCRWPPWAARSPSPMTRSMTPSR